MDRTTHTSSASISIYSNQNLKSTHFIKVRNLRDVDQIYDGKVLDLLGDAIEGLIHRHALTIPVMTEAEDHDAVFLRFNSLVNVPARRKVRKEVRHGRTMILIKRVLSNMVAVQLEVPLNSHLGLD